MIGTLALNDLAGVHCEMRLNQYAPQCQINGMHVVVIVAVLAFASGTRFTLNVPQVLLPLVPPSGVKANFTLTADKGCFKWCASIGLALDVV